MGKKVEENTKKKEAESLRRLIDERWSGSDSSFASACGRARAELNQHLNKSRPMPLDAVKAYASTLGCAIAEISERWAAELIPSSQGKDIESDNFSKKVRAIEPQSKDKLIAEVVDLMLSMSEAGRAALRERALVLAVEFPKINQAVSSQ